ncbi:MAG: ferrochelatase [Deltaproteobacteria bacterium]|nr:ferrochelatase [Deltaproteobacteria bacterium]
MTREGDLPQTAVLLLAFGGPRSVDEVGPFMERLMGKKPSSTQIEGLKQRYQAIGGASPLPETSMRQARALAGALKRKGTPLPVFVGMRYGRPLIAETLEEIRKEEISRIILISLSPYRSTYSSEGYYAEVKQTVAVWNEDMKLVQADDWHAHPGLCAAWAARINDTIEKMGQGKEKIPVVFTAHSLPKDVAASAPYQGQLEETIEGIIKITGPLRWHLAFQSRGRGGGEWLGPEPEKVLEDLMKVGFQKALICPIGFLADHLETFYDLDIALKSWADKKGIKIIRIPCLNDAPELIEVLVHLVEKALERQ